MPRRLAMASGAAPLGSTYRFSRYFSPVRFKRRGQLPLPAIRDGKWHFPLPDDAGS
jgi:hypothetical protein